VLAEQSALAMQEISREIKDIQDQIESAVTSMSDSINYVGLGTKSIDDILIIFTGIEKEIDRIKNMSFNISEIAKVLLDDNKKIFESVSNTSAISEEAVASTFSVQEMVNKQKTIFLNLQEASEHLDELSASLLGDVSNFKIN